MLANLDDHRFDHNYGNFDITKVTTEILKDKIKADLLGNDSKVIEKFLKKEIAKNVELQPTREASEEDEVDTFDQGKDACFRSVPRERYDELKG